MLEVRGEGELGIKNQGRFRFLSFSQETKRSVQCSTSGGAGQRKPGNGNAGPEQGEPSAGRTPSSNSSPLLFSLLVLCAAPASFADADAPAPAAAPTAAAPSKALALPRGVSLKKKPRTPEELKKSIREAADQYEKYFLTQMLKAMRATISDKGGMLPAGQGQKIFQEQLDDQYIEAWNKRGGVGYSDLIYNQVIERYGAQMGLRVPEAKPRGVLPLARKGAETFPVTR